MTCDPGMFNSMKIDVYYSTETQDSFGAQVKNWQLNQTLFGYMETIGAANKESLDIGTFFEYEDKLIGRTTVDPRRSIEGIDHPITSVLLTNIRDAKSSTSFYNETSGVRNGEATVFDVMSINPYVNPWNDIEYYKVYLARSDRQEINGD